MMDTQPLHSFPNGVPPEGVLAGLRALRGLPRGAQQNLWHLIEPELDESDPAEQRQRYELYAHRFEANLSHVLAAARTCAYLLRRAAEMNLSKAAFASDLERISGSDRAALELLEPRFESIRDALRIRLLEDTLADHGNVLVDFDWRIDEVRVSNHGEMLGIPVVFMNLKYRHGTEQKQLPLQLTPSAIASLKEFWTRFEME